MNFEVTALLPRIKYKVAIINFSEDTKIEGVDSIPIMAESMNAQKITKKNLPDYAKQKTKKK